jgi:hypothetical protein
MYCTQRIYIVLTAVGSFQYWQTATKIDVCKAIVRNVTSTIFLSYSVSCHCHNTVLLKYVSFKQVKARHCTESDILAAAI